MQALQRNHYKAYRATSDFDIAEAMALRGACFRQGGDDRDTFDQRCSHIIVRGNDRVLCTFRMLHFKCGSDARSSYAAQYYDLTRLTAFPGSQLEIGRFCVDPSVADPNVLRMAWGAVARFVDEHNVGLMFGCSSFVGTSPQIYSDTFSVLNERHLAPTQWMPDRKAPHVIPFTSNVMSKSDTMRGLKLMPPLLKTYLGMGGWVSDHAVVDNDLNTLHVFTGVEIAEIPPARARALRAIAAIS